MILSYHNLSLADGFYTISSQKFEAQLSWLMQRFTFTDFETYILHLKQGKMVQRLATLTFDDGFASFQELALPILEKLQVPAINFIPSGYLGKVNDWDRHVTDQVFSVVSATQLAELARHPLVTIGGHGVSHTSLGRLSTEEIEVELKRGKRELEEITGQTIQYFSFPYGQIMDMPKRAFSLLPQTGYLAAVSSRVGKQNHAGNLFNLYRVSIEPFDTLASIEQKVSGNPGIFKQWMKEILWKCKLRGTMGGNTQNGSKFESKELLQSSS